MTNANNTSLRKCSKRKRNDQKSRNNQRKKNSVGTAKYIQPNTTAAYKALLAKFQSKRRDSELPKNSKKRTRGHAVQKFCRLIMQGAEEEMELRFRFLHPAYRQFIRRQFQSNRLRPATKSLIAHLDLLRAARKIKRRSIMIKPLPRTPLFLCHWCGVSSDIFERMVQHICKQKRVILKPQLTIQEVRNLLESETEMYTKDEEAIMESLPNPQWVHMRSRNFGRIAFANIVCFNPPTLKQIVLEHIQKLSMSHDACNDEMDDMDMERTIIIGEPTEDSGVSSNSFSPEQGSSDLNSENPRSDQEPETSEEIHYLMEHNYTSQDPIEREKISCTLHGMEYYCPACNRLFPTFSDYQAHMRSSRELSTKCRESPIKIDLATFHEMTESDKSMSDYNLLLRAEKIEVVEHYECTKCHQEFFSAMELHVHIFKCALL